MARNGRILLCKGIKLDRNYRNVLNYSESQMLELCSQNIVAQAEDYSFIRDKGTIKVGFNYDTVLSCNYIAFENPDYAGKWFFAFIDKVNFISPGATEIEYTIDIWSTWFSYWVQMPCFVVREHVSNDTIGLHTVPENIDVGEVIEEQVTEDLSYNYYWVAISSSWDIYTQKQFSAITVVDKAIWGKKIYLIKATQQSLVNLGLFIFKTAYDKHIEDIGDIFIVPDVCIDETILTQREFTIGDETGYYYETPTADFNINSFNTEIQKRHSFSDYTPKNNKCFVYPYNYLFVSNNQGSYNIFKYEDFYSDTCIFRNDNVLSIGGSGRIVPLNYKKMAVDDDDAIVLGKFPICGWSSDSFTNWLTQNSVNLATNFAQSVTEAPQTKGMSIANNIMSQIGGFYTASLLPNIEHGNMNVGDVIYATDRNLFSFREMRVKTEYMQIIDNFFSRFGYKINLTKMANLTGRQNYNYVEIGQDETLAYTNTQKNTGSIPSNALETINNCFRSGVTIWHNHENLGNFNVDNGIV